MPKPEQKSNNPKRHHYVPRSYQLGFAEAGEALLWLYDRYLQRCRKVHPTNICCENDLYTIDPEGTKNRFIETQWLSRLDGEGATAIRRFKKKLELDDEWKESFSIFIAQQITRTPAFRTMMLQNYKTMGEEYLRIGFSDVGSAQRLLHNYRTQTGDTSAPSATAESLVKAVVGGHLSVNVSEAPFLDHMMRHLTFLAKWLKAFDWTILIAPEESGFIICDYPFVLVPSRERPADVGFELPGIVKYFPLTRSMCLRMDERGYGFSYRNIGKEEVRIINQNVAVNSERFIMGPNMLKLEHIIARSGA